MLMPISAGGVTKNLKPVFTSPPPPKIGLSEWDHGAAVLSSGLVQGWRQEASPVTAGCSHFQKGHLAFRLFSAPKPVFKGEGLRNEGT